MLFLIYGLDLIGHRTPRPVEETPDGGGFGGSSRRPSGGVASGNGPGGNTATLTDREVIEEALIHEGVKPVAMNRYRFATLAGIGFLVVGSVAFGIDVGVSSICISAVLLLMAPSRTPRSSTTWRGLPWCSCAGCSPTWRS